MRENCITCGTLEEKRKRGKEKKEKEREGKKCEISKKIPRDFGGIQSLVSFTSKTVRHRFIACKSIEVWCGKVAVLVAFEMEMEWRQ